MMMKVNTEIATHVITASTSRRPIYISITGFPSCAFPRVARRVDPVPGCRDTYRAVAYRVARAVYKSGIDSHDPRQPSRRRYWRNIHRPGAVDARTDPV